MKTLPPLIAAIFLLVPLEAKPKIAILDVRRAILSTEEGKAAVAGLRSKWGPEESALIRQQQEIEKLERELGSGTGHSAEENAALQARLGALREAEERGTMDARERIKHESTQILNDLGGKMMSVVGRYAKQKHFEVVLDLSDPNTPVYWRGGAADITDEVIKRYNQASRTPGH
jgi:outer membrane protein